MRNRLLNWVHTERRWLMDMYNHNDEPPPVLAMAMEIEASQQRKQ